MQIKTASKYVYINHVEALFVRHWEKSLSTPESEQIVFDFSSAHYMDLMQLVQMFIWIEKLLICGKKVHLTFLATGKNRDVSPSALYFIANRYGFFAQLLPYERLSIAPDPAGNLLPPSSSQFDSPLIHLTQIASQSDLDEFLRNEDNHDYGSDHPYLPSNPLPHALRSAIRNIILREVGSNVFAHAGSVPAILAVAKKSRVKLGYSRNPTPIKEFAKNSQSDDFVQVVIGDFGVGIPGKLTESFRTDQDAKRYFGNEAPDSVIEYAFWKDSSSRRREIEEMIDTTAPAEWVPPTGLYFVKQFVKRAKGMICVRAGDTLWSKDYSTGAEKSLPAAQWGVDSFLTLPGTVIQAILPTRFQQEIFTSAFLGTMESADQIEFGSYVTWNPNISPEGDEKTTVASLVKEIRSASIHSEPTKGILVDLQEKSLPSKRLFQVACYLMFMQDASRQIVIANPPTGESWDEVCRQVRQIPTNKALRPVRWISGGATGILGMPREGEQNQLPVSTLEVQRVVSDALRKTVQDQISRTFYKDARVFLPAPSSCYIQGYFHLSDVLSDWSFCSNIVKLLLPQLAATKFVGAVTTSSRLIELARMFASALGFPIENVFYQPSDRPAATVVLELAKLPRGSVLVISDAAVTGLTIARARRFFNQKSVAISLVAGSDVEDVIPVVRHSFEIFKKKPKDWRYDDIRPISSATHQFIDAPPRNEHYVSESVLTKWADDEDAVYVGHYSNDQTCYLAFFNTYRLQDLHNDEILEHIRGDLTRLRSIMPTSGLVFGCPANNNAARKICDQLHTYMGGSIDYVAKTGAISYDKSGTGRLFVFIDTAASTTRTIRRAMEYASRKGYGTLQIYIVVNRARMNEYDFVQGIELFKGVDVRITSQWRAELPAFSKDINCPACRRRRRLEDEVRKAIPASCRHLLAEEISQLKLLPIREAREHAARHTKGGEPTYGTALQFRQVLERAENDDTMESKATLLELIDRLTSSCAGTESLIDVLWRESDTITDGRIWDDDLSETLVSTFVSALQRGCYSSATDRKAIWAATGINFELFLKLISVEDWRVSDGACAALIASIFIYRKDETVERTIHLLRDLSASVESDKDRNFPKDVVAALREAANWLELEDHPAPHDVESFTDAIRVLRGVFLERGSSHPRIRRVFDDARRLIIPEDLPRCLAYAVGNDDSLFNTFKTDILPALKKVIAALPDKLLGEAPYVFNMLVSNDLNSFKADLEIADSANTKGRLSDEDWERYKRSIHETTNRILRQFIEAETSELYFLLERCESRVDQVLAELKRDLFEKDQDNLVLIQSDVPHVQVPTEVTYDVCRTLLENALRYGERGADIVCEVSQDTNLVIVETRNIPFGTCWPVKRSNHGLQRASEALEKFGGWVRLPGNVEATDKSRCTVAIGLPKKWG